MSTYYQRVAHYMYHNATNPKRSYAVQNNHVHSIAIPQHYLLTFTHNSSQGKPKRKKPRLASNPKQKPKNPLQPTDFF